MITTQAVVRFDPNQLQQIDLTTYKKKSGFHGVAHNLAPPIRVALIKIGLDDRDATFRWLERDFAIHDEFLAEITVDSAFDGIRADPRFTDLLERMHLRS